MTDGKTGSTMRLVDLEPRCSPDDALAFFDGLPPLRADEITGRWRGRELATGHPMDGVLEASGWYGKQFDDVDAVHPLLFEAPNGAIFPLDPRRLPMGLAGKVPLSAIETGRRALGLARPVLGTRKHRARLRNVDHRGIVSAAMVYDHLPVIDHFRRVDDNTLLGMMDQRGVDQPYLFILARD